MTTDSTPAPTLVTVGRNEDAEDFAAWEATFATPPAAAEPLSDEQAEAFNRDFQFGFENDFYRQQHVETWLKGFRAALSTQPARNGGSTAVPKAISLRLDVTPEQAAELTWRMAEHFAGGALSAGLIVGFVGTAAPAVQPVVPTEPAARLIRLRKNVGNVEYERQCEAWLAAYEAVQTANLHPCFTEEG